MKEIICMLERPFASLLVVASTKIASTFWRIAVVYNANFKFPYNRNSCSRKLTY